MITKAEAKKAQKKAAQLLRNSGVYFSNDELNNISVADFGLSNLSIFGAQILTLMNTDKISTKVIVMLPYQTLPEHWHPKVGKYIGKEETIRIE